MATSSVSRNWSDRTMKKGQGQIVGHGRADHHPPTAGGMIQVASLADVEDPHVFEGFPIVHAVIQDVGSEHGAELQRQAPPERELDEDVVLGNGPIAVEMVERLGHSAHVIGLQVAHVDVGLAAPQVDLPEVVAKREHLVRLG